MRIQLTTKIEKEMLKAIKVEAVNEGRRLNTILEEIIQRYLDEKKKD